MTSSFQQFWRLGYTRLVPIIPPTAELSESSALHKKLKAGKDSRGKAVGVRGSYGMWFGMDWLKHTTTEADLASWEAMGAGVGIRTGDGLVALDIDALDAQQADRIDVLAQLLLGNAPTRFGKHPKRLLLYRTAEPIEYTRIEFAGADGKNERVELLSTDRQFVAHGIHPGTGKPYQWQKPLTPYDQLPAVSKAQIETFFKALSHELPEAAVATASSSSADRSLIDQTALTGDLQRVVEAVRALPNTQALFPTYDDYIRVGAAIKGATQDDPHLGVQLFQEWAEKYDARDYDENTAESAEADYRRIKPPFELGARWLYDKASEYGDFKLETVFFDVIHDDQPQTHSDLFALDAPKELESLRLIAPLEWDGKEPAPREWEVEGWIPKGEVTLLYGDGGIGKTLVAQQYATSAAAGIDWLGQPTRRAKVLCFLCEDSEDELHRRQRDINAALCLDYTQIDSHLRYTSRKFQDNTLAAFEQRSGKMTLTPTFHQLHKAAIAWGAEVIIIDTIADVFAGSEIDRVQVNQFVKTCLGKLAQDIKGTVIALGHPSMAGKSSGSGTSGSTAWNNAVRSRIYLDYPKGTDKGDVRELKGMKSNYGPRGNLLKLRWNRGAFDVIASAMAAVSSGGASRLENIPDVSQLAVTKVLSAFESLDGVKVVMAAKSPHNVVKVLRSKAESLVADLNNDDIKAAVDSLLMDERLIVQDGVITLPPTVFT